MKVWGKLSLWLLQVRVGELECDCHGEELSSLFAQSLASYCSSTPTLASLNKTRRRPIRTVINQTTTDEMGLERYVT